MLGEGTADGGIGAAATTSASGAAVCGASCFRPLPGGVVMFDMIDFLAPFLKLALFYSFLFVSWVNPRFLCFRFLVGLCAVVALTLSADVSDSKSKSNYSL